MRIGKQESNIEFRLEIRMEGDNIPVEGIDKGVVDT
jgi:hypothetical protein